MSKALRGLPTILVGMLLIAVLFTAYTAQQSLANHEPANKTAAAGSDVDEIEPDGEHVVLEDVIRVSSSQDAIVAVTSECSILTSLITGDDEQEVPSDDDPNTDGTKVQDWAYSFGQVEMWVEIDGQKVPVTYSDTGNKGEPTDPGEVGPGSEGTGEVVFCNRAYQRTVEDSVMDDDEGCEEPVGGVPQDEDGDQNPGECEGDLDVERDYIDTRTANGFNWLAKDLGFNYDETGVFTDANGVQVTNGNNIVLVQLVARYATETDSSSGVNEQSTRPCPRDPGDEKTCAEAYVGSRTMIVEPTNVAIHEWVTRTDGEGN